MKKIFSISILILMIFYTGFVFVNMFLLTQMHGGNLNEITQDYMQNKIGIETINNLILNNEKYKIQNSKLSTDFITINMENNIISDVIVSGGSCYNIRVQRNISRIGKSKIFWNENFSIYQKYENISLLLSFFNKTFFVYPMLTLIVYWLYRILRRNKLNGLKSNTFNLSVIYIFFCSFLIVYFFPKANTFASKGVCSEQVESIRKNKVKSFQEMLMRSTTISFLSNSDFDAEKTFQQPLFPRIKDASLPLSSSFFISKTPFFPFNYVRFNIDRFNYIFYAPDMSIEDLKMINSILNYTTFPDGFFVGRYENYIQIQQQMDSMIYNSAILLGILSSIIFILLPLKRVLN